MGWTTNIDDSEVNVFDKINDSTKAAGLTGEATGHAGGFPYLPTATGWNEAGDISKNWNVW